MDNGTNINIYKTVLDLNNISRQIKITVDNISQVFVNGRYMMPAMPMNFKNPTDNTTGNPKNPEPGTVWEEVYKLPEALGIKPGDSEYYEPGELKNLDSKEEWAFDSESKTLYLYGSDNFNPNTDTVRVRILDSFLSFFKVNNVKFKNIHFFAGSFLFTEGDYLSIEDSKFTFNTDYGFKA